MHSCQGVGMLKIILSFCLFSYSLQLFAKTVVISDIDDTLKKANSMGKAPEQIYHFLKKVPYLEMRDLFNEIKTNARAENEAIEFYYVSAAQRLTFNPDKWIKKYNFPIGRSSLKSLKEKKVSTYDFKHEVIKAILLEELKNDSDLHVLMFGDNAQADAVVYTDLTRELSLDSEIFIRDVRAEATFFDSTLEMKKLSGVDYYFSEVELFIYPAFSFVSSDLRARAYESYKKETLIPGYTLKTLARRLTAIFSDKKRAESDAQKFWNDYYARF